MRLTFKHIIMAMGIGAVAVGCSDWDDHYDNTSLQTPGSSATLWENLSNIEAGQFSDFAALVKQAGYDEVLSSSQAYTVFAPVNGSIANYDELMQMSVEKIRTEFIENHIAHHNFPASGAVDKSVIMLNNKVNRFSGNSAGYLLNDSRISRPNIPSSNGVIHALEGQMPFLANIYESLDTNDVAVGDFSRLFHSFDHNQLNLAKSTSGPVVNGELTYLDSVVEKWNDIYDRFDAYVNAEDSSYTMVVPTNAAYNNAMERIKQYFNYAPHFTYRENTSTSEQLKKEVDIDIDAAYVHDSIVKRTLFSTLFINNNIYDNRKLKIPGQLPDSIYTSRLYDKIYAEDVQRLLGNATRQEKSNGAIYITDSIALPDWVLWNPYIRVEGEGGGNRANTFNGTTTTRWVYNDAIPSHLLPSNNGYAEVIPLSQSNNPEIDYYLPNVRSTTYAVYGVFAPDMSRIVTDSMGTHFDFSESRPNRVRVMMGYNDENGNPVEKWFGSSRGSTTFDSSAEKVDTVYFGDFTFPIAYAHTGYTPYIRIESRVTNNQFDRTLRIDCVLLIPKDLDEYLKEHPDYELVGWGKKRNIYF